MMKQFEVIQVTEKNYETSEDEQMGSKTKFWFNHEKLGRCLYKEIRQDKGEDWSEKIAAELCKLLGLPHANYELARNWEGKCGVVSPRFLSKEEILLHGNEILAAKIPNYPKSANKVPQHTIDTVLKAIEENKVQLPINWIPLPGINTAIELFVGYLLLDTWIGNTDRHHENWGFIKQENRLTLAPTYDHASCLGRELFDNKRQNLLDNKNLFKNYIKKCRTKFYDSQQNSLKSLELFNLVATKYPNTAHIWLTRLEEISFEKIENILVRIPNERFSFIAAQLVQRILEFNQSNLINLKEKLA
jgi:hypothetical protein